MDEERILTLAEIETRYPEQWVLVVETSWDEQGDPTEGIVIACGFDREALVEPTQRLHSQQPGVKSFAFYTGLKVPDGVRDWTGSEPPFATTADRFSS